MKTETGKSGSVPLSPLLTLQRATHLTLHQLMAELTELDLTPSEINAIANLAAMPFGSDTSASDLAVAVGVKPTTLTGILDRLQRRGLISRTPSETDRRAVSITLTDPGAQAADKIRAAIVGVERRVFSGVDRQEMAAFRAVLETLIKAAQ